MEGILVVSNQSGLVYHNYTPWDDRALLELTIYFLLMYVQLYVYYICVPMCLVHVDGLTSFKHN